MILGTTQSGKDIFKEPSKNIDFRKQDHLDAYNAHALYLMQNELAAHALEKHRSAMNEHYLRAANLE